MTDYQVVSPGHIKINIGETGNESTASEPSEPSVTGVSKDSSCVSDASEQRQDDKEQRLKDSKIAEQISISLRDKLAFDEVQGEWYQYRDNVWGEITDKTARRIINQALSKRYRSGFTLSFLRNIEGFLQMYLFADSWEADRELIPMKNGVLSLKTKKLSPHSHLNRFRWSLPFAYDPAAKCPTVIQWLRDSTYGDDETMQIIRCCFYLALIGSKEVQKFLELVGPGGTGKSTLVRLMIMLIGEQNHVATDLKNLEGNRFEVAVIYGKRLAVISDSSRYGGEVSVLKAITGGDPVRLEKKNKQQGGSFVADCFVVIASNEAIQSSDYSSGLVRRRVPVNFERRVTEEDKAKWRDQGGIENAMKQELPGLLNWVLELTEKDANRILGGLNGRMTKAQLFHLVETNKLAAWLEDNIIVDESSSTYTGTAFKDKDVEVQHEIKTKLYPNYQQWCEENGVNPIAVQRFGNSLDDLCQLLKLPVKREQKDQYGRRFTGLAIRNQTHHDTPTSVTKSQLNDDQLRRADEYIKPLTRMADGSDDSDEANLLSENNDDLEVF